MQTVHVKALRGFRLRTERRGEQDGVKNARIIEMHNIEPGQVVEVPSLTATELAAANKVEVVQEPQPPEPEPEPKPEPEAAQEPEDEKPSRRSAKKE